MVIYVAKMVRVFVELYCIFADLNIHFFSVGTQCIYTFYLELTYRSDPSTDFHT